MNQQQVCAACCRFRFAGYRTIQMSYREYPPIRILTDGEALRRDVSLIRHLWLADWRV